MTSDLRLQTEEAIILSSLQAIGTPPKLALELAREMARRIEEWRKLNTPKEHEEAT